MGVGSGIAGQMSMIHRRSADQLGLEGRRREVSQPILVNYRKTFKLHNGSEISTYNR